VPVADGIRIQPTPDRWRDYGDMRNRPINVRDLTRPVKTYPRNPVCSICRMRHEFKTYHFQLDSDGTVMVSTTIWDRLRRLHDCGGFEVVNVVAEPPAQGFELPPAHIDLKALLS
jgi:hypothetical protein